jgi:hypothetical protein
VYDAACEFMGTNSVVQFMAFVLAGAAVHIALWMQK